MHKISHVRSKMYVVRFRIAVNLSFSHISVLAVHCEWDDWVMGSCSAECGTGTRINTRVKLVEERNGGTCTGRPTEVLQCQDKECPSTYKYF